MGMTLHPNAKNITGKRFGMLIAIEPVGRKRGHIVWACKCDCGGTHETSQANLTSGRVTSCRCKLVMNAKALAADQIGTRRGSHPEENPLYSIWVGMRRRCRDEARDEFRNYGGRGISVCERWETGEGGKSGFECFVLDMGKRPDGMTVERINNDGDYEPGNCRWATRKEQAANTRRQKPLDKVA